MHQNVEYSINEKSGIVDMMTTAVLTTPLLELPAN